MTAMASNSTPAAPRHGVVLVTTDSESAAQALARTLVEQRLAACVNILPIQSVYRWQDQIEQAAEWQLLIKTDWACLHDLQAAIHEQHSYDLPEIIALPIESGSGPYLAWISQETAQTP